MLDTRKNILITGGTGSLGSALVARWHQNHNITVLSRDWLKQAAMSTRYPSVNFVLADICNYDAVYEACLGKEILIHAAAIKDVTIGERQPGEITRVNVGGTETVAKAWREAWGRSLPGGCAGLSPRKALLVSTDKACSPVNTYGMTKGIASSLFLSYGYSVIRYGNVIGSNGSFLPAWQKRIAQGLPIKVRMPSPTRFALTIEQAVELIEDALEQPQGYIYAPHSLPAFEIRDVANHLGALLEYEPLLPGEKQHEVLLAEGEGAVRVSNSLALVTWDTGGMEQARFCSRTAERIRGEEVLKWL